MSNLIFIKTRPNHFGYSYFTDLPNVIYGEDHQGVTFDASNPYLESCYVLLRDQNPVGRFAIYKNPNLKYQSQVAVCIGSYECIDDFEIAQELLQHAKEVCVEMGYNYAIGPMNGSTWDNYRFSLESDNAPFFMDLNQHCYYNEQFLKTGFGKIADYRSNIVADLKYDCDQLEKFENHYRSKGAIFRNIDASNADVELYKIATFCNKAFANNFLFTEIDPMQFVKKYIQVFEHIDNDLIWIVEDHVGEMHALFFAIPDFNDATGKTLIIKTMACLPDSKFRGVTTYLVRKTNQLAKAKGYQKIIHALFIKDNLSQMISNKLATACHKEYALYGINLLAS